VLTEGDVIVGKPSKGTPKDRRLKENKSSGGLFGGKKAKPFKRGGGRKR
jgi:hypothetical protein